MPSSSTTPRTSDPRPSRSFAAREESRRGRSVDVGPTSEALGDRAMRRVIAAGGERGRSTGGAASRAGTRLGAAEGLRRPTASARSPCILLVALFLTPSALRAGDEPRPPSQDHIKVIKVWASDEPQKDEKQAGPKDELKDYRKRLEGETKKRHFSIEGKVTIEEAIPAKPIQIPLPDDCKLQITPAIEGKGKEEHLVLWISLFKKDAENKKDVEKRSFKVTPRLSIPYIYCTPIRRQDRDLVVIFQKLSGARR